MLCDARHPSHLGEHLAASVRAEKTNNLERIVLFFRKDAVVRPYGANANGLKTDCELLRVEDHIPAMRQLMLQIDEPMALPRDD